MIKSLNPRRIITAGGTLVCALGIGYFMQLANGTNVTAAAERSDASDIEFTSASVLPAPSPVEIAPVANDRPNEALVAFEDQAENDSESAFDKVGGAELSLDDIQFTSAAPELPRAAPHPEAFSEASVELAMLGEAPIAEAPSEESVPALACNISMQATPSVAAMVRLELNAACLTDTQFTLHHNGMMISAVTDANGNWTNEIPALARKAVFIAAFDNGEGAVANAEMNMLDYYDRYVVQWKGRSGLQIHAMEYGADYGQEGHVWKGAGRDMAVAAKGEGGFILRLGEGAEDTALMAEIYTFPTHSALREGDVQISLEAEVHTANCGRDVEAQALIKSGSNPLNARDLTLAMPECNAVGDFLVLKNLYEDLKIARN